MHETLRALIGFLYATAECANLRYGETTQYTGRVYSTYTTISNLYNQFPSKTVSYENDIASFPEVTRYPNYSPSYPGYSTTGYSTYSTARPGGYYNHPGYTTALYGQSGRGYTSYEMPFMKHNIRDYCVDRSPQNSIWIDDLVGIWYGVEVIQHLTGDSRVEYGGPCIVIHISEPRDRPSTKNQYFHVEYINAKFQHDYRHLRLVWDEAGATSYYTLFFRNESAGYWQVYDGQNGTLTKLPNYQQFSGSIQVLKAVNDHLVLSFCQEPVNGVPAQLYSVLFSREPGMMARWEIDAVHTMLQTKKLSIASRRIVCGNGADRPLHGVLSLVVCIVAYLASSS